MARDHLAETLVAVGHQHAEPDWVRHRQSHVVRAVLRAGPTIDLPGMTRATRVPPGLRPRQHPASQTDARHAGARSPWDREERQCRSMASGCLESDVSHTPPVGEITGRTVAVRVLTAERRGAAIRSGWRSGAAHRR